MQFIKLRQDNTNNGDIYITFLQLTDNEKTLKEFQKQLTDCDYISHDFVLDFKQKYTLAQVDTIVDLVHDCDRVSYFKAQGIFRVPKKQQTQKTKQQAGSSSSNSGSNSNSGSSMGDGGLDWDTVIENIYDMDRFFHAK